jgi:hypothetical protein
LSAAETYGASPQAVMVTQVMVPKPRRPILVGRHKVVFYTRARIEHMPTHWHETQHGRFKVSTPELTALELVGRETQVGGVERVRAVLRTLCSSFTEAGMAQALKSARDVPTAQRLGALLAVDGQAAAAAQIARWLHNKQPRIVSFESAKARVTSRQYDPVFKVRLPVQMRSIRT